MANFPGDARRHIEEIVRYVSILGGVALVDLRQGTIDVEVGAEEGESFFEVARSSRWVPGAVMMIDDRTVVGTVGTAHALVLRGTEPFPAHAIAVARVARACLLLNRMFLPIGFAAPQGSSGGSGTSGAAEMTSRNDPAKPS